MALARDQAGFVIERIELPAFQTTFDPETRTGRLPVNTTLFPKADFKKGIDPLRPALDAGLTVGGLVAVAEDAGLQAESTANSDTIDFEDLVSFYDL